MNNPGCFGVPSVFSFKSSICGACQNRDGCQKQAYAELQSIKGQPHAVMFIRQHEAFMQELHIDEAPLKSVYRHVADTRKALTEEQTIIIESMPKKVAAYLKSVWTKDNYDNMLSRLSKGENPFDQDKNRTHHAVFEEIKQAPRNRADLVEKLRVSFDWTYSSAYSEISAIWKALVALNFAYEDGKMLRANLPASIA